MHRRIMFAVVLFLLVLTPAYANAQQGNLPKPHLVKDIANCSLDSNPQNYFNVNGTMYFSANDGTFGKQLWKSDGTATGTSLVINLKPATNPGSFFLNGNFLYFVTTNDLTGASHYQLWRMDVNQENVTLVKDLTGVTMQYPGGLRIYSFTATSNLIFFILQAIGYPDAMTPHLWRSDGTEQGTFEVFSWPLQTTYYNIRLAALNDWVFFTGFDADHGYELWSSDGTTPGTMLFKDLQPNGNSDPEFFMNVGNSIYFATSNSANQADPRTLWVSDGTPEGTLPVSGVPPVADDTQLAFIAGYLYFPGYDGDYSNNYDFPYELYRLEISLPSGNSGASARVKDINPNGGSNPTQFQAVGDLLFFTANDGVNGNELWRSDGSEAGTFHLSTTDLGGTQSPTIYDHDANRILFSGNYAQVWETDGSQARTVELTSMEPYYQVETPKISNGKVFSNGNINCVGIEPQVTDINTNTTQLLKDINTVTGSSYPRDNMIEYNGRAFFINSPSGNLELWSTDGNEIGTQRIYQFQVDPTSYTTQFEIANSRLFIFLRNTGDGLVTIYCTDGTPIRTNTVTAFYNSTPFWEHPLRPVSLNNFIYYVSTSYLLDSQFMRTDGSTGGTQVLRKFTGNVSFKGPFLLNNRIYLLVWTNNKTALELWQSDGTPSGTVLIKSMDHPPVSFNYQLVSAGNKTFFIGSDSLHGDELWETDGTAAGTQMVSDLTPGSGSTQFYPLNLFNIFSTPWYVTQNTLYFVTSHDQTTTLWKTQGRTGGIQKVFERPNILLQGSSNGKVYFSIADDPNAPVMWTSDGTPTGTRALFTIDQQWVSTVIVGGLIFYSNTDSVYGQEVWVYNGATEQTNILGDINPSANGYTGLHPMSFVGNKLWISGFDDTHGDELWVYDFLTNQVFLPSVQSLKPR